MRQNKYFQFAEQTKRQTRWWSYAAWTLPFVALAILTVEEYLGLDEFHRKILGSVLVIFFSASVFWWWWALHKIKYIIESLRNTDKNFEEVKQEIRQTRQVLKGE